MEVPPGIRMIGFADDHAVVGVARTGELFEDLVKPVWATVSAVTLARLMPTISGAAQWKRRLLGSLVESQVL